MSFGQISRGGVSNTVATSAVATYQSPRPISLSSCPGRQPARACGREGGVRVVRTKTQPHIALIDLRLRRGVLLARDDELHIAESEERGLVNGRAVAQAPVFLSTEQAAIEVAGLRELGGISGHDANREQLIRRRHPALL